MICMVGVGFRISGLGSYASRGDPPLVLPTLLNNDNGTAGQLVLSGSQSGYQGTDINELPPDAAHTLDTISGATSNDNQLIITAIPTGGNGVYSFAWTITETSDLTGVGGAGCAVLATGTTNKSVYDEFTFRVTQPALIDGGGAPVDPAPLFTIATYDIRCTVTSTQDGATVTASQTYQLRVKRDG